MSLRSKRKWCITGTPVHNSLEDLFSLTEFLGFRPVENRLNARRWILDPLRARDEDSIENFRMLVRSTMLRRSRDSERNVRRSEHEVKVILSSAERELYNSIRSKARKSLSSHDRFSYILKMRQVCSHGLLGRGQRLESPASAKKVCPTVCHWCGGDLSPVLTRSSTFASTNAPQFCFECADEQGGSAKLITESPSLQDSTCEEPNTPVSDLDVEMLDDTSESDVEMEGNQMTLATPGPSAKIDSVLGSLLKLQKERHHDMTPIKRYEMRNLISKSYSRFYSLVFSVWTTTLDALENALSSQHLSYSRIDGSRSLEQRSAAIHSFKTDPDLRIMLLSFGTGSVGSIPLIILSICVI